MLTDLESASTLLYIVYQLSLHANAFTVLKSVSVEIVRKGEKAGRLSEGRIGCCKISESESQKQHSLEALDAIDTKTSKRVCPISLNIDPS